MCSQIAEVRHEKNLAILNVRALEALLEAAKLKQWALEETVKLLEEGT